MSLTRHHSALLAAQADGSSKCSSKDPRGKVKRGQHHYNSPVVVGRSAAQLDDSLYETTPSSALRIIIVGSHFDNSSIFLVGRCCNLEIYCLV
jgi:hypothetical protein